MRCHKPLKFQSRKNNQVRGKYPWEIPNNIDGYIIVTIFLMYYLIILMQFQIQVQTHEEILMDNGVDIGIKLDMPYAPKIPLPRIYLKGIGLAR